MPHDDKQSDLIPKSNRLYCGIHITKSLILAHPITGAYNSKLNLQFINSSENTSTTHVFGQCCYEVPLSPGINDKISANNHEHKFIS